MQNTKERVSIAIAELGHVIDIGTKPVTHITDTDADKLIKYIYGNDEVLFIKQRFKQVVTLRDGKGNTIMLSIDDDGNGRVNVMHRMYQYKKFLEIILFINILGYKI